MQESQNEKKRRPPDPVGLKAFRDDANTRERSNVEAYDRAVLTLSTAALGVSLTFIKDIVEPAAGVLLPVLYASWGMLVLTVALTIASFLYGTHSIRVSRDLAPRYFLESDDSAAEVPKKYVKWMRRMTYASAVLFVGGLASLALFVILNIHHEANSMSNESRPPGWTERGLAPGTFESFTTPQAETTRPAGAQPATQADTSQGSAQPASSGESGGTNE